MEHLTYSLWFTLVWWVIMFIGFVYSHNEDYTKGIDGMEKFKISFASILVPAIAILLEYLIVR